MSDESLWALPFRNLYHDLDIEYCLNPVFSNDKKIRWIEFYKCKRAARIPMAIHRLWNWNFLVWFAQYASQEIYDLCSGLKRKIPGVVTVLVVDNRIWLATSAKGPRGMAGGQFHRAIREVTGQLSQRFTGAHACNLGCGESQAIDATVKEGILQEGIWHGRPNRRRKLLIVTVSCNRNPSIVKPPCSKPQLNHSWGCEGLLAELKFTVIDREIEGQDYE